MSGSVKERGRKRSVSRLHAVQALFQMETRGQEIGSAIQEFIEHRFGESRDNGEILYGDVDFFRALVSHTVDCQVELDQLTARALVEKWPLGRIDPTMRAIFRAAGAELLNTDTPPKVVIKEFVDIARAFFPEKRASGLVNAVLDYMAREVRPEEF